MRFNKEVLIEIVSVIQDAIMNEEDASQSLREIDVETSTDGSEVCLSSEYISSHPRG